MRVNATRHAAYSSLLVVVYLTLCTTGCGHSPTPTPTESSAVIPPSSSPSGRRPTLRDVSLSSTTVAGGQTSTGTVLLSDLAPDNGFIVDLSSSDAVATVPSFVTVDPGSATGTFTIGTRVVAADTAAIITAFVGSQIRRTGLIVIAPGQPRMLQSVEIDPPVVTGGQSAEGTVRLVSRASTRTSIAVRSSSSAVTVPFSATVPEGQTSGGFFITTRVVTEDTVVTITAQSGTEFRTAVLRVRPPS
jgi:hypothetical protein